VAAVLFCCVAFAFPHWRGRRHSPVPLHASLSPAEIVANGYDHAVLTIRSDKPPKISFAGDARGAELETIERAGPVWHAEVRAGILPGHLTLRVEGPGAIPVSLGLELKPQTTDSASDGTPDFLRLEDATDQQAFLRWFRFLAEVQYFTPAARRAPEISDCAALVRYAYREALRRHDANWSAGSQLLLVPAIDSIRKYGFPHTPLGPALFRVRGGTYQPADLTNGAFAQFADAATLERFNTFFVSRDVTHALPGDLLFFRREVTFHSMVFVGRSQIESGATMFVVYHTGPEGANSGEIRRLSVDQLLHYPDPQWQAIATNSCFLGVFRWNILKATS
jgi:uncharacterized protein YfaT (DUF1175 family)